MGCRICFHGTFLATRECALNHRFLNSFIYLFFIWVLVPWWTSPNYGSFWPSQLLTFVPTWRLHAFTVCMPPKKRQANHWRHSEWILVRIFRKTMWSGRILGRGRWPPGGAGRASGPPNDRRWAAPAAASHPTSGLSRWPPQAAWKDSGWVGWVGFTSKNPKNLQKPSKTKGTQRKSEKPMGSVTCQKPNEDFSASHHFHIQVVEKTCNTCFEHIFGMSNTCRCSFPAWIGRMETHGTTVQLNVNNVLRCLKMS